MLTLWGPQELSCDNVALLAFAYTGVGYIDLDSIFTDAPTLLKIRSSALVLKEMPYEKKQASHGNPLL